MGASNADVPDNGSGVKDWECLLEAEQERKRVTDLGRSRAVFPGPKVKGTRDNRIHTALLHEDRKANKASIFDNDGRIHWLKGGRRFYLESANHRKAHIRTEDLALWLECLFDLRKPAVTRTGNLSLRLHQHLERKREQSIVVHADDKELRGVFASGDWQIWSNDGAFICIPYNHASTAVEALAFTFDGERISATFPHRNAPGATNTEGDESAPENH